jgi:hypothetical protein
MWSWRMAGAPNPLPSTIPAASIGR